MAVAVVMFMSRGERWAFAAVVCVLAIIVALLLASCQMPLRTALNEPSPAALSLR